jgi:hypothetical protein
MDSEWTDASDEEGLPRGVLEVQVYDDRLNSEGEEVEGEEVIFERDEVPSDSGEEAYTTGDEGLDVDVDLLEGEDDPFEAQEGTDHDESAEGTAEGTDDDDDDEEATSGDDLDASQIEDFAALVSAEQEAAAAEAEDGARGQGSGEDARIQGSSFLLFFTFSFFGRGDRSSSHEDSLRYQ